MKHVLIIALAAFSVFACRQEPPAVADAGKSETIAPTATTVSAEPLINPPPESTTSAVTTTEASPEAAAPGPPPAPVGSPLRTIPEPRPRVPIPDTAVPEPGPRVTPANRPVPAGESTRPDMPEVPPSGKPVPSPQEVSTPSGNAQAGAAVFRGKKCTACHGETGGGDTAMAKNLGIPPLGSSEVQSLSDARLAEIIANGRNPRSAAAHKSTNLSAEEIRDVIAWIRTLGVCAVETVLLRKRINGPNPPGFSASSHRYAPQIRTNLASLLRFLATDVSIAQTPREVK